MDSLKQFVFPLVRHGLTVAAGFLAAKFAFDGTATEGFISVGMALFAYGWSVIEKKKAA